MHFYPSTDGFCYGGWLHKNIFVVVQNDLVFMSYGIRQTKYALDVIHVNLVPTVYVFCSKLSFFFCWFVVATAFLTICVHRLACIWSLKHKRLEMEQTECGLGKFTFKYRFISFSVCMYVCVCGGWEIYTQANILIISRFPFKFLLFFFAFIWCVCVCMHGLRRLQIFCFIFTLPRALSTQMSHANESTIQFFFSPKNSLAASFVRLSG